MSRGGRLLLFDVDGTLVHVDGAGRAALRFAMGDVYGETGPIDMLDFHGKTDPAIVRELLRARGLPDDRIERGFPRLWGLYCQALGRELASRRHRLRVCPGVPELLARLGGDGRFVTGLVTGNVEDGARRKLGACGLDGAFPFGAFGSDSERRADLPPLAILRARAATGRAFAPREVFVIGDTPRDIDCARAAGVRVLAVATGRHPVEALARHGADAVLPDLRDAERVLDILEG